MIYQSKENKKCYFPPLLSNGDISLAPDAEGTLRYTMAECQSRGMHAFDGIVVRAERRSALCNALQARFFPMGKFVFSADAPLSEWSQELKPEDGVFESDCDYTDGTVIHSRGFIHPTQNIYALEKKFSRLSEKKTFFYTVRLCGYDKEIGKYMRVLYAEKRGEACVIGFQMYGMDVFKGEIRFFVDAEYTASAVEDGIQLAFDARDGDTITFYYYLEDDLHGVDYASVLQEYEKQIRDRSFSGLLSECKAHYKDFFDAGYVKTSDETLNRIYKTSLYSIKCNTTRFSVAVGFNNASWDGRYFAFDEYTSFYALLSSNRHSLAKRVPLYRLHACLPAAVARASDSHRTEKTEDMARFHWETGECDRHELAPDGHWLDHIFHIPLVGIGAFHYYEYTKDEDFLRECYPMIRACAKFITGHMVYQNGSALYIGKCTDLERLGSSIENPFMTACGAIKLLLCCKEAAAVLDTDAPYAEECGRTALRLLASLPEEDGRFVPHLGCRQKSIAVFAGKFPFDLLDGKDPKMRRAWDDFETNGRAYGNMYPVGGHISPWYACWKAIAYARANCGDAAYSALKEAYPSAGVFSDLFEINEEEVCLRPWFATAAGVFVSAVNDMLLQCNGQTVRILPALPRSVNASFKLAAKGGITVEAEVKDGKLEQAIVLNENGVDVTKNYRIEF